MSKFACILFIFLCFIFTKVAFSHSLDTEPTAKMLKDIRTMELRHFEADFSNLDVKLRIEKLEKKLFGESYNDVEFEKRIKRLRIASQKKMTQGASIPNSVGISRNRIQNNNIKIVDDDNVGIVDGFMKLYTPKLYRMWLIKHETELQYELTD